MTGWPHVRLGDYIRIKHGFAFQGEYFSDEGDYIVLTPGNFIESGGFKPKSGAEKYYNASPPADFILRRGDLVIAMTEQAQGLLGSSALIPVDNIYLHNQRIGLAQPYSPDLDPLFLYYLFNTSVVRDQIQATATGSKVRHTAPARVENVIVPLPPLDSQRKIAACLSAYDDLIENNTRRIKLLEEMTQSIYREWFINFRYPGYENVPLVNSEFGPLPDGWTVQSLSNLVENVRDHTTSGADTIDVPYVPIDCISPKSLCLREWQTGDKAKSSLIRFARYDILFGAMRPYFHKVAIAPFAGTTRSTCFVLRAKDVSMWALAVMILFDDRTIDFATGHSSGSTIPYARWAGSVSDMPVVLPNREVATDFEKLIAPILQWLTDAGAIQANLQATRDFLLPRLVSGEIDVSDLDINLPQAAA